MLRIPARARPLVYGEVLFDHFPDGSTVLGGAPFNVAWHLRGFGEQPLFIGRVGHDDRGQRVRSAMADWGMDLAGLQTDPTHPTGSVHIEWRGGEPRYAILADQAYDSIQALDLPDVADAAFLYHGSLALRQTVSRATLDALLSRVDTPVFFDVNLRSPWWREPEIRQWMNRANWVKLNQEEWARLSPSVPPTEAAVRAFIDSHALQGLLLTHGKAGAQALTIHGTWCRVRPAPADRIVDTVGAGDAFTAVFLLGQLLGWTLARTLQRAQDFASAMIGVRGATVADPGFYRRFLDDWKAA